MSLDDFQSLLASPAPLLALAPMQDVTDLPFWRLMTRYGGADVYYTEYFRVHPDSHLNPTILRSITENPTGRPVVAQMIGNDIPSLVRTARELQNYPIVAVDLNLGCPAPVVYRKCAGGGLLRELWRVDAILDALRDAVRTTAFTVKTRIGFDSPEIFEELLGIFRKHAPDLVTVHARTVTEAYGPIVHYEYITRAAAALSCPVLANGNVHSAPQAAEVMQQTGVRGLMIGRWAIRNPWIFRQIREHQSGAPIFRPRGRDLLDYIHALYEAVTTPGVTESKQVQKMKKYLNFIAQDAEPTGAFLHEIRRVRTKEEFFSCCEQFLAHSNEVWWNEPFTCLV